MTIEPMVTFLYNLASISGLSFLARLDRFINPSLKFSERIGELLSFSSKNWLMVIILC